MEIYLIIIHKLGKKKMKAMYKEKYYNMFDKFFQIFGKKTVSMPENWVEKGGEN